MPQRVKEKIEEKRAALPAKAPTARKNEVPGRPRAFGRQHGADTQGLSCK